MMPSQICCGSSEETSSNALMCARLPLLVEQPVAHPPHVEDVAAGCDRAKLAPQAGRVRVQGPGAPERAEAPNVSQQLLLREDPGRIGHELKEQLVLLAGERDRHSVDADTPRCEVGRDRTCAKELVARRCRPPKDGANPRQQLLVVERPREKVIAAA